MDKPSDRFVILLQTDSIIHALRYSMQPSAGETTVHALQKLRSEMMSVVQGKAVETFPEPKKDMLLVEALALAGLIRGTLLPLLTDEEAMVYRDVRPSR